MMVPDWLDSYLMEKPGVTRDYKAEWGWERYMVGGKMFAAVCCPGEGYAQEYAGRLLLSVKCDPLQGEFLRGEYPDVLPGFYMDKIHWISARLDGELPRELFFHLCDGAYRLVFQKLTKKLQSETAGKKEP